MQHIDVVVAVIEDANRGILISKRRAHQHLAGWWEFPGGKVDVGEGISQALHREIQEELGLSVTAFEFLYKIDHDYPEKSVSLHVFHVTSIAGDVYDQGQEGQEVKWVPRPKLREYEFPPANERILEQFAD